MANLKYYFPGISLIIMAIIIVVFPQILVAMIAATILLAGVASLYIGHKMRRGFDEFEYRLQDSLFDDLFVAQPIFRRWFDRF